MMITINVTMNMTTTLSINRSNKVSMLVLVMTKRIIKENTSFTRRAISLLLNSNGSNKIESRNRTRLTNKNGITTSSVSLDIRNIIRNGNTSNMLSNRYITMKLRLIRRPKITSRTNTGRLTTTNVSNVNRFLSLLRILRNSGNSLIANLFLTLITLTLINSSLTRLSSKRYMLIRRRAITSKPSIRMRRVNLLQNNRRNMTLLLGNFHRNLTRDNVLIHITRANARNLYRLYGTKIRALRNSSTSLLTLNRERRLLIILSRGGDLLINLMDLLLNAIRIIRTNLVNLIKIGMKIVRPLNTRRTRRAIMTNAIRVYLKRRAVLRDLSSILKVNITTSSVNANESNLNMTLELNRILRTMSLGNNSTKIKISVTIGTRLIPNRVNSRLLTMDTKRFLNTNRLTPMNLKRNATVNNGAKMIQRSKESLIIGNTLRQKRVVLFRQTKNTMSTPLTSKRVKLGTVLEKNVTKRILSNRGGETFIRTIITVLVTLSRDLNGVTNSVKALTMNAKNAKPTKIENRVSLETMRSIRTLNLRRLTINLNRLVSRINITITGSDHTSTREIQMTSISKINIRKMQGNRTTLTNLMFRRLNTNIIMRNRRTNLTTRIAAMGANNSILFRGVTIVGTSNRTKRETKRKLFAKIIILMSLTRLRLTFNINNLNANKRRENIRRNIRRGTYLLVRPRILSRVLDTLLETRPPVLMKNRLTTIIRVLGMRTILSSRTTNNRASIKTISIIRSSQLGVLIGSLLTLFRDMKYESRTIFNLYPLINTNVPYLRGISPLFLYLPRRD